jgi:hypothetical protein
VRDVVWKFALTSNGPLSGKTTLAQHLEQAYGFFLASHSRSLVKAFVADWNKVNCDRPITVEDVYRPENKERYRPLLQTYGYTVGFNDRKHAAAWVRYTLADWFYNPTMPVVFDPVRGEVQAQALRDLGFQIVQLEIDEQERCRRAKALGVSCADIQRAIRERPELERGVRSPDITLLATVPVEIAGRILTHTLEGMHGSVFEGHVH